MNNYSAVISLDWTALIRERDRLRMLRFADAWQAIGMAAVMDEARGDGWRIAAPSLGMFTCPHCRDRGGFCCVPACGLCRQTFDASEELCGDCLEETDDTWRLNLGANLAAAGMAATLDRWSRYPCQHNDAHCIACNADFALDTMREAVS